MLIPIINNKKYTDNKIMISNIMSPYINTLQNTAWSLNYCITCIFL